MKALTDALKPLQRKIWHEQCLRYVLTGLAAGMAVSVVLLLVSKFVWVPYPGILSAGCMGGLAAASLVAAHFRRPSPQRVAQIGDGLGYQERFVTAMELLRNNDRGMVAKLVVSDAVDKAREADFGRMYPVRLPPKQMRLLCLLVVCLFLAGFMPSPKADELERQRILWEKIEDEARKMEDAVQRLTQSLSEKDAKAVKAEIQKMLKELKKSKTDAEAIKTLQKTQEALKKISKNAVPDDLRALGERLSQHTETQTLGESLQNGRMDEIESEMRALQELLENAAEEERGQIAEMLAEAAKALAQNEELAESLGELSDTISSGDMDGLREALGKLSGQIEKLASENTDLREAMESLNRSLAESGRSMQNQNGNSGQNQGQQGQREGKGQQQGQGQNQGEGQPQGQGQNQGQGQQGQGQSQGQGQGSGRGTGHVENENIYSRKAEGYGDYEAHLEGTQNEDGTMTEQERKGMGDTGGTVPYSTVIGQYRDAELKALEEFEIPYGMKELVKEYFSTLE